MTPDECTIQETFLEVGDGHTLYVHDWGNKAAKTPIVYLHGGPGSGCSDGAKKVFDPTQQRVIFFDQRGCGRSLPLGSLEHNTTDDLIEDINKVVEHVGVESFILNGGSWGSCLALAYGIKHPERVKAMVLWGIFTGAKAEIDYFAEGAFRTTFPEVWETYLEATPKQFQGNPTKFHYTNMAGKDAQAKRASACAYENLEGALCRLDDRFTPSRADDPKYDPSKICMEAYYMQHGCFMPDRFIFENVHKLTMPIWLVQGRYDFVCLPQVAHELHQKLPRSQIAWTISGHAPTRDSSDVTRALMLQLTA